MNVRNFSGLTGITGLGKALCSLLFALSVIFCVGAIPLKLASVVVPGVHVAGSGLGVALIGSLLAMPINYGLRLKAINLYSGFFILPMISVFLPDALKFSCLLSLCCGFVVFELFSFVITFLVLAVYAKLANKQLKLGFGSKKAPSWFYVFNTDEEINCS
jgi:hypothetical protein